MATNYFIQIDSIPSESKNEAHAGWIEVSSFHHSLVQPTTGSISSGGGMNAERAHHGEFSFTKAIDKATPKLLLACSRGDNFSKATLHLCRNTAGEQTTYMEIIFTGVVVSTVQTGVEIPRETLLGEQIGLTYTKIEWKYVETDQETGRVKDRVNASWDLKTNTGS